MSHDDKKKMAKRMVTKMSKNGKVHAPKSGFFNSPAWEERKMARAKGVENKNTKIKKAIEKKKKAAAKKSALKKGTVLSRFIKSRS